GPHGGTHTLLAAAGRHIQRGGSLTRYVGNMYKTLGPAPRSIQAGRRIKTHLYALLRHSTEHSSPRIPKSTSTPESIGVLPVDSDLPGPRLPGFFGPGFGVTSVQIFVP